MTPVAKVLIGLGITIALISPASFFAFSDSSKEEDIEFKATLADVPDAHDSYKYGWQFKHHFVSTEHEENKPWWNTSFRHLQVIKKRYPNSLTDSWKYIEKANSLSDYCEAAYGQTIKDIHLNSKYLDNIWSYCSIEREMPRTLKYETEYRYDISKIGGRHNNRLISCRGNDKWWEIQEKAFFRGLGHSAIKGTVFSNLYFKTKSGLKETCNTIYSKYDDSSNTDEKLDALKFCSI